ncbi:MAG: MoaD/ThiS family protein [Propionibacteriaceae bacterium]|jgi:molybdopterin converting factor small subunit|nr:MoaD/ThiS family protein [Propionibacteriaceae bacterium]
MTPPTATSADVTTAPSARAADGPAVEPSTVASQVGAGAATGTVTVRYFAAARAAAGIDADTVPAGQTLAQTVDALGASHGPDLASVLARCSFLVNGVRRDLDAPDPLPGSTTLDVLPPFAGG